MMTTVDRVWRWSYELKDIVFVRAKSFCQKKQTKKNRLEIVLITLIYNTTALVHLNHHLKKKNYFF